MQAYSSLIHSSLLRCKLQTVSGGIGLSVSYSEQYNRNDLTAKRFSKACTSLRGHDKKNKTEQLCSLYLRYPFFGEIIPELG